MNSNTTTELIEELRATFEYHEGGYLIRKNTGKPCGQHANHSNGYARVNVGGRMLYAHSVIYAINHGKMPTNQIDHINKDRIDNRIENLREVSSSENSHNYKKPKTNTSGFTGVSWKTQAQKWVSYIWVNNKKIHLGLFENFEDAVQSRKMAKIKHHPTSPEAFEYALELFPCKFLKSVSSVKPKFYEID